MGTRKGLLVVEGGSKSWDVSHALLLSDPITMVLVEHNSLLYAAAELGHFSVKLKHSADGGASWECLGEGMRAAFVPPDQAYNLKIQDPQSHAYNLAYRHGLDIDITSERLAFGNPTGNLWIWKDQGNHWQQVSAFLLPIY